MKHVPHVGMIPSLLFLVIVEDAECGTKLLLDNFFLSSDLNFLSTHGCLMMTANVDTVIMNKTVAITTR